MKRKLLVLIFCMAGILLWRFYPTIVKRLKSPSMETSAMPAMNADETAQGMVMRSPKTPKGLGVTVIEVVKKNIQKTLRAVGKIAYDERKLAKINLRVEGWIQTLYVNFTGQPVKPGQPLFTLYSPALLAMQQEYLLTLKSPLLRHASEDMRQIAQVLRDGSRQKLLRSHVTEAQLAEIEARGEPLSAITLFSPIHGTVIKREGARGMRVTPEMTLYEIADLRTVWVWAQVYENDLDDIEIGAQANITLPAYPGKIFHGTVSFIDPFLNPETRSVGIRLELQNPDLIFKPEMFAEVVFHIDQGQGMTIPEATVLDSGPRKQVFVDMGMDMYVPREIQATRNDGHYVVTQGLKEGERIVASANFLIDSESKLMASSNMMGALGMAGIKMEQAHMGEMDMGQMQMGDMATMPLEKSAGALPIQGSGEIKLILSTDPSPAQDGENMIRIKIQEISGKPVEKGAVTIFHTMQMPGMTEIETAMPYLNGQYAAKVNFSMPGVWKVTAHVRLPKRPEIVETFEVIAQSAGR